MVKTAKLGLDRLPMSLERIFIEDLFNDKEFIEEPPYEDDLVNKKRNNSHTPKKPYNPSNY